MKHIRILSLFLVACLLFSAGFPAFALSNSEKEELYIEALTALESYLEDFGEPDISVLDGVIDQFTELGGYNQSPGLMYYAQVLLKVENGEFDSMMTMYLRLMDKEEFNKYIEDELPGTTLRPVANLRAYAEARKAESEGNIPEAIRLYDEAGMFYDSVIRYASLQESAWVDQYDQAIQAMMADDFEGAYFIFDGIREYRDSDAICTEIISMLGYDPKSHEHDWQEATYIAPRTCAACGATDGEPLPVPAVGTYVTFGHYPQTADGTDNTPIEWLVMDYDAENNKVLLFSRYGLDTHRFDEEEYRGWDKSEVRGWLNSTFLNRAFTTEEQQAIAITTVKTEDNGIWLEYIEKKGSLSDNDIPISGGPDTQDKVFLLSLEEIIGYKGFKDLENFCDFCNSYKTAAQYTEDKVIATQYAIKQGSYYDTEFHNITSVTYGNFVWGLRSPFRTSFCSDCMWGEEIRILIGATRNDLLIRPALWLDLSAIEAGSLNAQEEASDQSASVYAAQDYSVGSYVTYGTYPQTADGNDNTPIEWLVLDMQGDKALLISRYGLDYQPYNPYNTENAHVVWENCSLRAWLNVWFFGRAFTKQERSRILTTDVDNSSSQCFDWSMVINGAEVTTGSSDTQDKIFLLSYAEANKYFNVSYGGSDNSQCRLMSTAYAEEGQNHPWLLRSPGEDSTSNSCVDDDGLHSEGRHFMLIRPAFWLDLSGI